MVGWVVVRVVGWLEEVMENGVSGAGGGWVGGDRGG